MGAPHRHEAAKSGQGTRRPTTTASPETALDSYERCGFALWPHAVADDLCARLSSAFDDIQASADTLPDAQRELLLHERDLPARHRNGLPASATGNAIFIIADPLRFDTVFRTFIESSVVRDAAHSLLGTQDVVVHFVNVTTKHPGFGRAIGWHRDFPNPQYSCLRADFLRLMLCLDGMDASSGATGFVSGSHHISDEEAARQQQDGWPRPLPETVQLACCDPGQLVAIHPKVLHGGAMNTSGRSRRNIVLQVGRADAPLTTAARETMTGHRL